MIAFCLAVLAVGAGGVSAGYAGSSSENDLGHGGTGDGYGYGYSGSFSGNGPPPNFAIPNFDFSGFLGNYVDSLSRYHQEFIRNLQNQAQGYGQPGGFSGGYGGSYGGGNDGAYGGSYSGPGSYSYSSPNSGSHVPPEHINFLQRGAFGDPGSGAASSSASIGPGGVQQTASVYPENPNTPNVNTRFASIPSGGGGYRSVFTSSETHTSNVNGKPVTVQKASTTVNDNGKVTTYTAKNP